MNRYLCNGWQAGNFLNLAAANAANAPPTGCGQTRYRKLLR
jgi:hypothetical protein